MQAALIAGEQVLVMLMLMAVGFVMYRMKLLSDETCAQLNKLLIVTVTFAVLVSSYNRAFDPVLLRNIGIGLLFATIGHIVGTVLAFIFVHGKGERARGERFACFVSNCGFMGIPLISAFVGPEGVIYASCGVLMLNVYQWTVGRFILEGRFSTDGILKRIFLNPGTMGCIVGLTLFCLPVTLPRPIATTLDYVASLNTPLAMIVIGTSVARTRIAGHLRDRRTYLICFIRLILVPLCCLPIFLLLGADETVSVSEFLVVACPCAATSSLIPANFGLKEASERGAGLVAISTVLSVLTIPLMVLVRSLVM